ncbi:MAG: extracellular solute-binding protein [Burkholderiales bacterium]|nr:extracellular solute-binding protein [Burkholderiales bacterium]MCE7877914.1 extracellular solute-binding protein [Betaproteobacteria bacterium PRO3]
MPFRLRAAAAAGFACTLAFATLAAADTITVITSFPKELTAAYKKAYEAKFPNDKLEILNKNTAAGIAYVREQAAGSRPEVFWASAPDAFEVLSAAKLLQKANIANPAVPAKIGSYPINDPEGFYYGQALAGYGIMWNTRYLAANKLPVANEWADLARPEFFGHVAISSPSRSGTTHLTVETILQGEGWQNGWAQILAISGNSAAITERSFGVPEGVANGQFGYGLVVDFFGLAAKYSGLPTDFVYPSVTAIVPANIGLVEGSKSPEAGKRFIAYTLSDEGQQLLLDKAISRLPVLPATYAKAPAGYPNPFAGKIQAKVNFDSNLSESRYYVVRALFDQTITFRHKELVEATRAIHEAQKRLGGRSSPQLDEARKLAFSPPIDEKQAGDKALNAVFSADKKNAEASKRRAQVEDEWSTRARANYARAVELANAVK